MGASALRVRSFYSHRSAQLPTTAQRRQRPVAIAVVRSPLRSLLLCCVGHRHRAARSLHSVRRRGSRSRRPPLHPAIVVIAATE